MNIIKSEKARPFLAFLCALGWSLAYPLIKLGYEKMEIMPDDLGGKVLFAGVRFFVAGLLVMVFCLVNKNDMRIKDGESFKILLFFALVNTSLHYLFSYIGLSFMTSSRSTILDSMGGFMLIILSGLIYTEDKFSTRKLFGCLFGICGIILINVGPLDKFFGGISFMGDGMILLNACCAALGGILTRLVSKKMDINLATAYGMTIGGGLLILVALILGPKRPFKISLLGLLIMTGLILISALCFGIYNALISCHPISKIAIFNALIPVLGVIFSSLILGERLKWQYFLAGLMVATGVCIINLKVKGKD